MTGLEFYRHKRQLTQESLAFASGVNKDTIKWFERRGPRDGMEVRVLIALADALGTTVDALVAEHDSSELTTIDRSTRESKICSPRNAVDNYRVMKNLRYQELADLLGLAARESARTVCKRTTARDLYIRMLANYEGLTEDAFRAIYLPVIPNRAN